MRAISNTRMLLAMVAIAAAAPAALSQDARPDTPRESRRPVLRGPQVEDERAPGTRQQFGPGQEGRRLGDRLDPRAARGLLEAYIGGDGVPDDARLTDEQAARVRELAADFNRRTREYMAEHGPEIRRLRAAAGGRESDRRPGAERPERPDRRRADRPMTDEPMDPMSPDRPEAMQNVRARVAELMEGAPRFEDLYQQIWAELDEPQRGYLQARVDEVKQRMAKEREEQYVRRRMAERGVEPGQTDKMEPGAPRPERPAAADAQRRERLMRFWESLSPDEQENLLERLEAFRARRAAESDTAPGAPARSGARRVPPPPPIDGVKVPKPDDKRG